MTDMPSAATTTLKDYFTTMAYDTFRLEDSPIQARFARWRDTIQTMPWLETIADTPEALLSKTHQASQTWQVLEPATRAAQVHRFAQAIHEDSEFLAILDSYDRAYPLSYARQTLQQVRLELGTSLAPVTSAGGVHLLVSAGYPQLSTYVGAIFSSLAQGYGLILLGKGYHLLRLAELWKQQDLPAGLLSFCYHEDAKGLLAHESIKQGGIKHKGIRLVSGLSKLETVPKRASLHISAPLPATDVGIITQQADSSSALHAIVRRCVALQRPCELWVQEAVLEQVRYTLEQRLNTLQQGHPWDSNADSCPKDGAEDVTENIAEDIAQDTSDAMRDRLEQRTQVHYQNSCCVLTEMHPTLALPLSGAVIALRSFRRLSDVPPYFSSNHKPQALTLWTESLAELTEVASKLPFKQLYLNRLPNLDGDCDDYRLMPAELAAGQPLANSFSDGASEALGLSNASTTGRQPSWQQQSWQERADVFYQLAAAYPHHSELLHRYAAQMYQDKLCEARQARGKVVFIFPADLSETSLAYLSFAALAAGNQLRLLSQQAGLEKAQKLATLTAPHLPISVMTISDRVMSDGAMSSMPNDVPVILAQADYLLYVGDAEGADIVAQHVPVTQAACYITHALPEVLSPQARAYLLHIFSQPKTIQLPAPLTVTGNLYI